MHASFALIVYSGHTSNDDCLTSVQCTSTIAVFVAALRRRVFQSITVMTLSAISGIVSELFYVTPRTAPTSANVNNQSDRAA